MTYTAENPVNISFTIERKKSATAAQFQKWYEPIRYQLIIKKYSRGLSPKEAKYLERLQRKMEQFYPRVTKEELSHLKRQVKEQERLWAKCIGPKKKSGS